MRLLISRALALCVLLIGVTPAPLLAQSFFFPGAGPGGPVGNASTTYEFVGSTSGMTSGALNASGGNYSIGTASHAYSRLRIALHTGSSSGSRYLTSISFDNGITWSIQNLYSSPNIAGQLVWIYDLPISVPQGAQIVAKTQASGANGVLTATVVGEVATSSRPPGYATLTALSIDTANTRCGDGTSASDVPLDGSAWVQIASSAPANFGAVLVVASENGTTPTNPESFHLIVGSGASGSEVELARTTGAAINAQPSVRTTSPGTHYINISAGQRISVKAVGMGSPGTDKVRGCFYGLS